MHLTRGPKGLIVSVSPAVLLAVVALLAQLLTRACR
jgi:hypothetical protein